MLFYSWSIFHFSGVRSSVAVRSKSASERIQVHSELIFSKKFKRTKTGFERCIMQITIAIKGALSSVTVHLYKEWSKEKVKTRRHEANHRSHEAE
ncbi:hypothetical protein T4A_4010 [Trichinella pseudospiralis]|uniref:Uncharacterized protein n=1 Tax=Trichinella pseudospiralis TaxID=6337 RepID=A0A0V1DXC2_TRIPS|nr:hypothetical protein T4A_4010 [Trichinella pseudospiralis]